jgi:hypothetical protein
MSQRDDCNHQWRTTNMTYAEPVWVQEWQGVVDENVLKMVHGVTTVLQECQLCHDVRKHEMLGKQITTKEETNAENQT